MFDQPNSQSNQNQNRNQNEINKNKKEHNHIKCMRTEARLKWATNKKSTRLIHACLRLRVVRSNLGENISFCIFWCLALISSVCAMVPFLFQIKAYAQRRTHIYNMNQMKWNVQEKCTHIAITFEAWNELRIQKFSVRDGNDDSNSDDDDDAQIWRINKNRFFL